MPGEDAGQRRLEEMIRVDHAGEYGAVQIYRGQRAVFDRIEAKRHVARLIADMEAGEQEHLDTFDRLLADRRVRPTLMAPVWRVAGFGLGAVTALMGERAAHADQSAALKGVDAELKHVVDRFRADEIKHKETAIEQGARHAPGYPLLSAVIKFGCRAAIRISEKI
jgi:ubiquinone biosynthesis monooxygenase Coq7